MNNLLVIFTFLTAILVPEQGFSENKGFRCTNSQEFRGYVYLKFSPKTGFLSFFKNPCQLKRVAYKPASEKYEGWIRFGNSSPKLPNEKYHTVCTRMFGAMKIGSKELVDVHWISVSRELQANKRGFAQLGFENVWDPGSGGTAKMFLSCSPIP